MKKQFKGFTTLISTAAIALMGLLFSACARPTEDMMRTTIGGMVRVSFADRSVPSNASRAFFDPTDRGEVWEDALGSLTICAFYPDGRPVVQRAFSQEELSGKRAAFALPDVVDGTVCDFYAVANLSLGLIGSKQELLDLIEENPTNYNGTFATVSSSAARAAGFVMSGSTTAVVSATQPTDVVLTLARTVAKVAVEVTPSVAFGSLYPGALRVDQITVSRAATQSHVVSNSTTGAMSYSFVQDSSPESGRYRNLFYLFANGAKVEGERVLLTVEATYDADGNFATPENQSPMRYEVELEGDGSGVLLRNGYYRVAVAINGLEGSDATVSFLVAPWRTPATQYVTVGM